MNINESIDDFKVYFAPWIKYWAIGIVVIYLARGCDKILYKDDRDMSLLGFLPAMGILFLLIMALASIYYWHAKYYSPKRKTTLLNKSNLNKLVDLGFEPIADFYCGIYKGYDIQVAIKTHPQDGEWIEISTWVHHKSYQKDKLKELRKVYEVIDLEEYIEIQNRIGIVFGKVPEFELVKKEIDKLIEMLTRQTLSPYILEVKI